MKYNKYGTFRSQNVAGKVGDDQRISSISNNTIEKLRKVKHKVFKHHADRRRTFLDSNLK